MFLVVGLGNPGEEYERTPHNLGFLVIDRLAERQWNSHQRGRIAKALMGAGEIAGKPVLLAKPQTYMNLSGTSVKPLMVKNSLTPADLILVYDELDLPWGDGADQAARVRPPAITASESVIAQAGDQRISPGSAGSHPGHELRDGAEYLLSPIKRGHERKQLDELVGRGAAAVRP